MCMLGGLAEDGERDKEEGKRAQAAQCPTLCHTDEWDSGIPRTHMPSGPAPAKQNLNNIIREGGLFHSGTLARREKAP